MGSYSWSHDSDVHIPADQVEPARQALARQRSDDVWKSTPFDDILCELGFEVSLSEGAVVGIQVLDEAKFTGEEESYLACLAPFVEDGDYIGCETDGLYWRWAFVHGRLYLVDGQIEVTFPAYEALMEGEIEAPDAFLCPIPPSPIPQALTERTSA